MPLLPTLPTLTPKPGFSATDAENIAKSFKVAMKGIGCDEARIIREITALTNSQRQIVKERFMAMYGHSLEEDLKDELRGNFEEIIVALLKPRFEYEAECVRKAMSGIGTREHVIIEILCTKDVPEIEKLKEAYKNLYSRDLENDLTGEEDGPLGRVFRSIATGDRPTSTDVDIALAQKEAKDLFDAGEGMKYGTDENEFVRILVSRSFAQLRATFDEYKKLKGKDIEDVIKAETTGHFEDALVAIVQSIRNRPAYFARQLYRSMEGLGTKENDLMRIIVTRCEIDMGDIKREYMEIFRRPLFDDLKKELTGDFEDIVLKLVGKD